MSISARIGSVQASHKLIEVGLQAGKIEIEFANPEGKPEFLRSLDIDQARNLASVLSKAADRLEEHNAERLARAEECRLAMLEAHRRELAAAESSK